VLGYFVTRDGSDPVFQTGTGLTHSGLAPATNHTYTVRALDTSGNLSGTATLNATTLSAGNPTLVPAGSTWKYLDDGSNQGTAWRAPGFDDSSWASGPALLGYGKGDEATVVSFGPNPSQKWLTTYLRSTFTVEEASAVQSLLLRVMRDDGAVVYINGTEVTRTNMPAGTITWQSFASTNVGSPADRQWNDVAVPTSVLVNGVNTIAVEVHQNYRSSGDLAIDVALEATY
jgi:hypothetical protein